MDLVNKVPKRAQAVSTSSERATPLYLYRFAKSLLYSILAGNISSHDIEVITMYGREDVGHSSVPCQISLSDEFGETFFRVTNSTTDAIVRFEGSLYVVTCFVAKEGEAFIPSIRVLGLGPDSSNATVLMDRLTKEAVKYSSFSDSFLQVVRFGEDQPSGSRIQLKQIEPTEETLASIFLPRRIMEHVELFIQAVRNYSGSGKPVRYLFAGKPGTAKTKVIRAIANACKGKATFIFTDGNEDRIDELFEVVGLFSSVVLCVDDIDLMTGSREKGTDSRQLAAFLQKLDGFINRDFFLLATTNDKQLVDTAASRPGRFDLILDISTIEPGQYMALIESKASRAEIKELFDHEVLSVMALKKASGAFIANLVKHLELVAQYCPEKLNREYVLSMAKESYEGFYLERTAQDFKMGFAR